MIAFLSLAIDDDDFAGRHVADELRAAGVERCAFAGDDNGVVVFAQTERTEAVRIARRDDFARRHHEQRIGAVDFAHGFNDGFLDLVAGQPRTRDEVADDLAVDGCLENGAALFELAADFNGVGQVAVVRNSERTLDITHNKRLRIFQHRAACR